MGVVDRTPPVTRGNLGRYNKVHAVTQNTTYHATGSNEAAAFMLGGTRANTTLHFSAGGAMTGSDFDAGVVHEIGVKKVVTGATAVVYLLK